MSISVCILVPRTQPRPETGTLSKPFTTLPDCLESVPSDGVRESGWCQLDKLPNPAADTSAF